MIDILDPTYVINSLFGNLYFFFAIVLFVTLFIAAKNRWNLQLTIFIFFAAFFAITIVLPGFSKWITILVTIVGFALSYIMWRFLKNV